MNQSTPPLLVKLPEPSTERPCRSIVPLNQPVM